MDMNKQLRMMLVSSDRYAMTCTGKALLHAQAGPHHVFADVAKHSIQDPASAYDLLLCPKHVFPPAGRRPPPAGIRPPARGRA